MQNTIGSKGIALIWVLINFLLSFDSALKTDTPWIVRLILCLIPAVFVLLAELIAALLPLGFGMQRFASDRDTPQAPAAIAFFGFILLAISTVLFLAT